MTLPLVGTVDWKWFLIGLLFALFVLPFLLRLLRSAT